MIIIENVTYCDNMTSSTRDTSLLIIFLDRSQLIMTIVGVIANIGTSITLIKNGQVSVIITVQFVGLLACSNIKEMLHHARS